MQKTVIFDFNRTIYDPEQETLLPFAQALLTTLKANQFNLFLITFGGKQREKTIKDLNLSKYFKSIVLTKNKQVAFRKINKKFKLTKKLTFVIGDRVREEIMLGNQYGYTTVWFKNGRFKNEMPVDRAGQPDFVITKLRQVLSLVMAD